MRTLTDILSLVYGLSLLFWPFLAFVSFFFFDAPGSEDSLIVNIQFGVIWAAPILVGLAVFIGRRYSIWALLLGLPYVVLAGYFFIGMALL